MASSLDRSTRLAWCVVLAVSATASGFLFWILYFRPQPAGSDDVLPFLPGLNCLLNGASACCLMGGLRSIRRGNRATHMRWMIAAFVCSSVFLVGYVLHHHLHGDTKFPVDHGLRSFYLVILVTHVVLSVVALPMIFMTFFASLSGRLAFHRRIARITFPIWLYVSVSGVAVFVLLKWAGA